MKKRYKVIACKVMMREMYALAAKCDHIVDILWLKRALHDTPDLLRKTLQEAIDHVENESEDYDAILLGYCLCSNGIVGIRSKRMPIVIPRGHDCITMLLGSKERYKEYFDAHNGRVYWYSPGWVEQALQPSKERFETIYEEYVKKYGEDNAKYLMEMEQGWLSDYDTAIYVDWPCIACKEYADYTKECAKYLNWQYDLAEGSDKLVKDMFDGNWDEERFVVIPPGKTIAPTHDHRIFEVDDSGEA